MDFARFTPGYGSEQFFQIPVELAFGFAAGDPGYLQVLRIDGDS
jgi:hypothetical protein